MARSRSIDVSDDQGASEHLSRLIETSASVQPGDSGGPLENAGGKVIGGAADAAGLNAGDVITAIDGHAISSPDALSSLLLTKHPGDQASVTYTDQFGASQTATVTLASGPPQ